jgi:DnaD/phage-associated family protein
MAGYSQFHTKFWKDEWVLSLTPLERYLFMYLFTNELRSISGIYKLPQRVIENETGLEREFIEETLQKFQDDQKALYKDGVIWVVNMRKYHKNASPRTMTKVISDLDEIPDCAVKRAYLYYEKTGEYSIDTVSIPDSERLNKDKDKDKDKTGGIGGSSSNPPENFDLDYGELCTIYQANIGPLAPMISDALEDDLKQFGLVWCKDAVAEAVKNNVRKWSYVRGILKRWKNEGNQQSPRLNGNDPSQLEQSYAEVW